MLGYQKAATQPTRLIMPEGYHDSRKLDTTGKVFLRLFLDIIVLLFIVLLLMA